MLILKAIGSFFVKIWRWIKDTAWVQPLLIVGAIFAVIFSIPYISEWVSQATGEQAGSFYNKFSKSLEGEVEVNDGKAEASEADKFTNILVANEELVAANTGDTAPANLDKTLGTKFFVVFTKEDCSNCDTAETGFKYLSENWNKTAYAPTVKDEKFTMYTISASEESTTDKDYENINGSTAFNRYLSNYMNLFNTVGPRLLDAPYYTRASLSEANYNSFSLESSSGSNPIANFPVPTILLVDYTEAAFKAGRAGISEVLFSVNGDTPSERASHLKDMWNHTDDYASDTDNLFLDNKAVA
ncbi:MAG: hypothetical protein MJ241_01930 [Bacilli bacterium]|nr:hypothetical protein [Bacilli bacterium]